MRPLDFAALSAPPAEFRDWRDRAACAGTDTDAFFLEQSNGNPYALRVCARCTVRAECLEYALAHNEWGIWGGMSEIGRRRLLAKRRREAAA